MKILEKLDRPDADTIDFVRNQIKKQDGWKMGSDLNDLLDVYINHTKRYHTDVLKLYDTRRDTKVRLIFNHLSQAEIAHRFAMHRT